MNEKKIVHQQIRKLREELKLSQQKMGDKLGIGRDRLNSLELGRVDPLPEVITHICITFGVNKEWLTDGKGEMKNKNINFLTGKILAKVAKENDSKLIHIIENLTELSDADLDSIAPLIEKLAEANKKSTR